MVLSNRVAGIDIRHATLSEEVYRKLNDAIIDQVIAPGAPLRSQEVAKQLGVSRTPVIEALFRLRQEGLINYVERQGFTVTKATTDDLSQLVAARLMCEVFAVRKRLASATNEELEPNLAGVEYCHHVIKHDLGPTEWARANSEFHFSIVKLGANERIYAWYCRLWELVLRPQANRRRQSHNPSVFPVSQSEHRRICDGIIARDIPAVVVALRLHYQNMEARSSEPPANSRRPTKLEAVN
jgi:DNA-binding GntR family transcriptional regulator